MLDVAGGTSPPKRGREQEMADILTFTPRTTKPRGPYEPPGEVVIFPGVVVERLDMAPASLDTRPAAPEAAAN